MSKWSELSVQVKHDLEQWYNSRPDKEEKEMLAELFLAGRFWAWNCPVCGDRVYWGDPEDWDDYQGVCQADYVSYSGIVEKGSKETMVQCCDNCRCHVFDFTKHLNLIGDGTPPCWDV